MKDCNDLIYKLFLDVIESKPTISGLEGERMGNKGDRVKLEATINGYPPPEVTWLKEGKPLATKFLSHKEGDNKYAVVIEPLDEATMGTYTVVAKNALGEASSTCKVTIQPSPPRFGSTMEDVEVMEGDPLVVRVVVFGFPTPEVIFKKDGTTIGTANSDASTAAQVAKPAKEPGAGSEATVTTDDSGSEIKLEIAAAQQADAGKYVVKARNGAGEEMQEAQVKVVPTGGEGQGGEVSGQQPEPMDAESGKDKGEEGEREGDDRSSKRARREEEDAGDKGDKGGEGSGGDGGDAEQTKGKNCCLPGSLSRKRVRLASSCPHAFVST